MALQLPAPAMTFWAAFGLLVALSQQFHSWSHMRRTTLPPVVQALQARRVGASTGICPNKQALPALEIARWLMSSVSK